MTFDQRLIRAVISVYRSPCDWRRLCYYYNNFADGSIEYWPAAVTTSSPIAYRAVHASSTN